MSPRRTSRTLVLTVLVLASMGGARAQEPSADPLPPLMEALEGLVQAPDPKVLDRITTPGPERDAVSGFLDSWRRDGITRVAIRLRERVREPANRAKAVVEVMIEQGDYARIATWQMDVEGVGAGARVVSLRTLGAIDGLYRLSLEDARQFAATNLRIAAEDFELVLTSGTVFAVRAGSGVTALVLVGRGDMKFRPSPETERGQVRIFAGSEVLQSSFEEAFVRMNPASFDALVSSDAIAPRPAAPRAVRDAQEIFSEQLSRSFSVDLGDLSRDTWSLLPSTDDLLIDVNTRRFGLLTYVHASQEAEDITVFDREHRRTIALYRSKARLASRGPFYDEDDLVDFDILQHTIDSSFSPDRLWFDGRSRLRLRIRAAALSSITLRLASTLTVRAVTSEEYGRLLFLRVRNQDSLLINLPSPLSRDDELTLNIVYAGRLEPVDVDREAAGVGQIVSPLDRGPVIVPEPSYLYSNRGHWYPQSSVTDYAIATIRMTLPPGFSAVCSGEAAEGSPVTLQTPAGERQLFVFTTSKPVRYLACVFARFGATSTRTFQVPGGPAAASDGHGRTFTLIGRSPSRQRGRSRELLEEAEDIIKFYSSLMGGAPFPEFTLALVESDLPGGQSPAYFAALNQPLPTSPYTWRNDPASFHDYPEFFLAHELAHQWWGHAIGWNSYHEQWLSEGFAQYFAALYAERRRGPEVFADVIETMHRWSVSMSPEGPIFLGYRLGHLQEDGRIFRALVYDKGAMVLHMLRRLVGDKVFFAGLRRFYEENLFTKAGTVDLQRAFEEVSGRSLQRFFDGWIRSDSLPVLKLSSRVERTDGGQIAVVRLEQSGRLFEFPVTVRLRLADRSERNVVVAVTERTTEARIPIDGRVREIDLNPDRAALLRDDD